MIEIPSKVAFRVARRRSSFPALFSLPFSVSATGQNSGHRERTGKESIRGSFIARGTLLPSLDGSHIITHPGRSDIRKVTYRHVLWAGAERELFRSRGLLSRRAALPRLSKHLARDILFRP